MSVLPVPALKPCLKCHVGAGEVQELPGFPHYKLVVCTNRPACTHRTPIGPGLFRAVAIWNGEPWTDEAHVIRELYDSLFAAVENPIGAWRAHAREVLVMAERSMQP